MSPEDALAHIQAAVALHEPRGDYQWFVDEHSIDCDATHFWGAVLAALKFMADTPKPPSRGGKGGVLVGDTWYFQPTDGKGCPNCGAIGTGGHGGGCNINGNYDERGRMLAT